MNTTKPLPGWPGLADNWIVGVVDRNLLRLVPEFMDQLDARLRRQDAPLAAQVVGELHAGLGGQRVRALVIEAQREPAGALGGLGEPVDVDLGCN